MPTEAKRETVAELREELANARTMIVTEYRGLKVKEIAEIRRALRKQDVTYHVVKNRLMRIAAEDPVGEALEPAPRRSDGDRVRDRRGGTAKAVLDATRPVQAGRPDQRRRARRRAIDAEGVTRAGRVAVARSAPGHAGRRDHSPVATLAGLLSATLRNLAYGLQQFADKKAAAERPGA